MCEICRTRWRDKVLCIACVNRALESREAAPEQVRAHLRQSVLSLALGIGGWAVILLVFFLIGALIAAGGVGPVLVGLLVIVGVLAGGFIASLGLGQAAAALRMRGNQMIMATLGMILNGLLLGVLLGIFAFGFWQI
jgi:hypothetical protein